LPGTQWLINKGKGKGKGELFFTLEMDERRIKNVNAILARLGFGFRESIEFFGFFLKN